MISLSSRTFNNTFIESSLFQNWSFRLLITRVKVQTVFKVKVKFYEKNKVKQDKVIHIKFIFLRFWLYLKKIGNVFLINDVEKYNHFMLFRLPTVCVCGRMMIENWYKKQQNTYWTEIKIEGRKKSANHCRKWYKYPGNDFCNLLLSDFSKRCFHFFIFFVQINNWIMYQTYRRKFAVFSDISERTQ